MSNRSEKEQGSQNDRTQKDAKRAANGTSNGQKSAHNGNTQSAPDAIKLLTDDHEQVRDAFQKYEELGDKAFVSKRKLADEICEQLLVHAQIEEEILYPEFAKSVREGRPLEREARVEHASARDLIRQIQSMDPEDELFDAKVTVLSEYIEHHVKEEETEMFPLMRTAGLDTQEMGQRLWERKQELLNNPEMLIPPHETQLQRGAQQRATQRR